ncbi:MULTISPECIES: MarC family protein [unclassified Oceanobacter]|jgi:multiple antibiotic resistance protein|uniref:MarC family protein n=1 Tax=unclassified Oceanobacter TaxID=2620260 RepID=UPI0027347D1C|nr:MULTISPECIES: MarC family protein [unclassified Oceanobacter]MDP2504116.1 MarC family protein [Oceanobacter sp. 3_MG-2023]MDP2546555.1 MarC family protein [Oceanobacter sp. 4_MG-2023]MDP2610307.1 MarC family protein [Oceanobacter sp. 1_MG-2023]MDP2613555.1 MarC family protein [Oceanobacter sp. 2_MG-2023]
MNEWIKQFVLLWSVIDPIGTIPVFIAVTASIKNPVMIRRIAYKAITIAALVMLFFVMMGEMLLDAMGIPLEAFQVAGGLVLFLFALSMIFGESKPEEEISMVAKGMQTAVFPLAIPSVASPGAMMAAVLLTDNHRFSFVHQIGTSMVILSVLMITLVFMLLASRILKIIGEGGASVISRVMGLILAAVAVNSVLAGIQIYFGLERFSS